ncbi:hypothetical protein [Endozoicomonas montiporae]|nr:hypothetical protein [Endozoicomonas montiporae]
MSKFKDGIHTMRRLFEFTSAAIYTIAAISLVLMAVSIVGYSLYTTCNILFFQQKTVDFIFTILQSVSSVIISIAIIDVAKYMVEEEILRDKELRKPKEARETITKIMVIISIAVSMEGLVYIFKAGTKDVALLIYPSILILCSVLVIIGLGIYQRLSSVIEEKDQKRHLTISPD